MRTIGHGRIRVVGTSGFESLLWETTSIMASVLELAKWEQSYTASSSDRTGMSVKVTMVELIEVTSGT